MPALDQETIRLFEDAIGHPVRVTYRVPDEEHATAKGIYAGPVKNSIGEWCVAIEVATDSFMRIQSERVVRMEFV
ncbi:MAG: hypothetical protein E6Q97_32055 [Desulfurellales bacterium]|nr:MAG: hypothetical protein E6Q97_32055 [Desulfurellales bacterium]